MKNLERHLQIVQDDVIQEFDPATIAVGVGIATARLIAQIVSFLLVASTLRRKIKVDSSLSKKINKILNSGNTWIVHLYPEPSPNAFAIGGKHIFVTTGLLKLLNEREVSAVMLHEIYHNKDLHIWKQFSANHIFFYLLIVVGFGIVSVTGTLFLGYLIFFLMNKISQILTNRTMGRRHELKADEYAVKFGYGNDMASALKKMEEYIQRIQSKIKCGKLCQMERSISEALDEHPPLKKRIEIVLRKAKELEAAVRGANFSKIKNFIVKVFKENG